MFCQSAQFSRSLYRKAPHYALARLSLAPHQDTWISGIFLWQWTSPSHLVGLHAASNRAAERLVLLNTKIATSNSDIAIILTYLLTYLLTHSMGQSPTWEANRFEASQEIHHILWKPEGSLPHTQVPANCPYPEPTRSSPYTHFLKIHLNIILPSTPGSSKWSLSLNFLHQNLCTPLFSSIRATCPAHLILDFITRTILGEEYSLLTC
jgi:hypothetical protein